MQGSIVSVRTTNGQLSILVEMPDFGGKELQTINILLQTGNLEFWDTGGQSLPLNTTLVPSQFTLLNPGGKPRFTGKDLNPLYTSAMTDPQSGKPEINAEMKGDAINRFKIFTARSIGDYMTITLDRKVLSSPVIQSSISGPFAISGEFTQQQVKALVSVLTYGPLPVALKKLG
jgi:preprotein translocase subunit SecD